MANYHGLLPEQSEAIVDQRGIITRKFRDFLAQLATTANDAALQAQITAIDGRVAELQGGGDLARFVQGVGIQIVGQITDPTIHVSLSAYLADLLDVADAAPADRDRLTWDAALATWKPAPDSPSADPTVPYFIPSGETYSVAANKQALFTMPIDVEGFLDVEGYLVGVG